MPFTTRSSRTVPAVLVACVGVAGVLTGVAMGRSPQEAVDAGAQRGAVVAPTPVIDADPVGFRYERLDDPARTVVRDSGGAVVATFTDGARTVAVTGPERTFTEPRFTPAAVHTSTWVRIAPQPWSEGAEEDPWMLPWLTSALADPSPDVLAVSMEYLRDAPDAVDDDGIRYAGNASFGPEQSDSERTIGSDFYDYLGVPWEFPDGVSKEPDEDQYRALDCSGFIRIVYGFRLGFPLLGRNTGGDGLPRRAAAMSEVGPGALVIRDRGRRPTDLDRLQPGDLLFFTTDAQPDIDHSGIFLGVDDDGRHRFVSSRSSPDGPTIGDEAGPSVLEGDGLFGQGFRSARRI